MHAAPTTLQTPVRPGTEAATAILDRRGGLIATSGNWERITAIDAELGLAESVWAADLADLRIALRRHDQPLSIALRVGRLVRTALVHIQGVQRGGVWFVIARCVLPGDDGGDASVSLIEAPVAVHDLVLVMNAERHLLHYANGAAQDVGAHRGDHWTDWVAAADRTRLRETLTRWYAVDPLVPLWESFRVARRDGEIRWVVAVIALVPGGSGDACCLAMDVTEERRPDVQRSAGRRVFRLIGR